MSNARTNFLQEIVALEKAVSLPDVGTASGLAPDPGVSVLRRGAAITGLVMLETFLRLRIEEILSDLEHWPAQYDDLPTRFRRRATIDALPHLEKYAKMLRRNQENYEAEIMRETRRIASMSPPSFQFTRFIAGDYTGNISEDSTGDLLKVFQVNNCWDTMDALSREIGQGVPSIKELLNSLIRNRHQSAHVAGYIPTANDVLDLPYNLRLIGVCIDAALTASIEVALGNWRLWVTETFNWKGSLEIYFISETENKFRLVKIGKTRAIRIVPKASDAKSLLPKKRLGVSRLLVEQSKDGRPRAWDMA